MFFLYEWAIWAPQSASPKLCETIAILKCRKEILKTPLALAVFYYTSCLCSLIERFSPGTWM
jgi:hypothetical protein